MIKMLTVVGARPQFIKAAAISRAIKNKFSGKISEVIVHTGQHYDDNMSEVFFREMDLPHENYNLQIGSHSHGKQTAKMLESVEKILKQVNPDCVMLYGDTNSTIAGGLAASKMHIPVIHVEGGVRSFNKTFPEEINRLLCDHLSTLIFTPTKTGFDNLVREGFSSTSHPPYDINNPKIYHCGDIMYDNSLYFSDVAEEKSDILNRAGIKGKIFVLVTIHRPSNVDDVSSLNMLFKTFDCLSKKEQIYLIIPLHPRTIHAYENKLERSIYASVKKNTFLKIIPAVSFLDTIMLEKNAKMIITDSGGVQKEAHYFKKPCIILLNETPWVELVESGSAILAGSDGLKIKTGFAYFTKNESSLKYPDIFGDGHAAEFICEKIIENFTKEQ